MKGLTELAAELIALVIGWIVIMGMLVGAFVFGLLAAQWGGASDYAREAGLLSALTFIWIYERREGQARRDRLDTRLDKLWPRVSGLD